MKMNLARVRTMAFTTAVFVITATAAHAQATRTWLDGASGSDANPCSRTAPCKTFAGAISKTDIGGFIDVINSGAYGAVTITKSITLDGSNGAIAAMLANSESHGITINSATAIVHLRNLSIDSPLPGGTAGQGLNGVEVVAAREVHIEHCVIASFAGSAVNFHPASGLLAVADTSIYNNAGGGIVVATGRAVIENLHANGNGNAVAVNGNAIATVRNSYAGNGSNGFVAVVNAAAVINIENCVATGNANGIVVNGGATARVSNSTIVSNSTAGMTNDGISFIVSLSGNIVTGNPTNGSFTSTLLKQ